MMLYAHNISFGCKSLYPCIYAYITHYQLAPLVVNPDLMSRLFKLWLSNTSSLFGAEYRPRSTEYLFDTTPNLTSTSPSAPYTPPFPVNATLTSESLCTLNETLKSSVLHGTLIALSKLNGSLAGLLISMLGIADELSHDSFSSSHTLLPFKQLMLIFFNTVAFGDDPKVKYTSPLEYKLLTS
ncbi:hypothetical protein AYI70_g1062 [Smittium culicis]|uniref:Uncharacterized protein n=1 Tax=Smittium culicis TaxID=133412 RepID=A0A1R1YE83_9FUNG|nr:hypothetical protein AYI70_g1062 [Smittium culicis]